MSPRSGIGGTLDLGSLAALAGKPDADRMQHFRALNHDDQVAALRGLAADGMSEHGIARASGLSVEMIRTLLAGPQ